MRKLTAWLDGKPEAEFIEFDDKTIRFHYLSHESTPISLSLLPKETISKNAPKNFLIGLLPQTQSLRNSMARQQHASPEDLFSLLAGADTEGGLVFTMNGENPVDHDEPAIFASDQDIASRIESIQVNRDTWWAGDSRARFSLNGDQPKFALEYYPNTLVEDQWLWPNATYPSTHIFKPSATNSATPEAMWIEAASSRLAQSIGLNAANNGVMRFMDQQTLAVERFDRVRTHGGKIKRIHSEDLLQALGYPPSRKYDVSARMILQLLNTIDPSKKLSYEWIHQLAFNTSINNTDAHAQNYSVLITAKSTSIAPLYDMVTTTFWPQFDNRLAMKIGGAQRASAVTPANWRKLAQQNNLDPDTVEQIATTVAKDVINNSDKAYDQVPSRIASQAKKEILKANQSMLPRLKKQLHSKNYPLR